MEEYYAYPININKKKSVTRTIYIIVLYLVLFLHIYRPLFLSFSQYIILILFPFFLISIVFFYRNRDFIYCLKRKVFLQCSIGFLFLFIYTALIDYTALSSINVNFGLLNSTAIFRTYFDVFLISIALYILFRAAGKSSPNDLIHAFLWISFLQFLFTFSMMSSPAFRDFININVLLPNKIIDSLHYQYRLFGFSSEQLFAFPLFNGLTLCAAIWLSHKRSPVYLAFAFFSLLPIIVNARVGLISVPAFLISFVIIHCRKILLLRTKFLLKTLFLTSLVFLLSAFIFYLSSGLFSDRMLAWIVDGALEVFGLSSSYDGVINDSTTLGNLLTSHLFLPKSLGYLLLGDSSNYDPATDIGYVKMIFSGGLIYFISYFFLVIWFLFNAIFRSKDYLVQGVLTSGFIMLIVANIKGLVFTSNGFLKAMFLLCIFVILDDIFERNKRRTLN